MKKSLPAAIVLAAIMAPAAAYAEGYGIIEHHAEGVAMGGAAMFIENDAGNMAYNPAGITLCEGNQIKVSATYIAPHGDYTVTPLSPLLPTETGHNRVHPAWAPGSYYVRKMDDKQWIGLGIFSRFGNMCEFEKGSLPATNNQFAKMNGLSITPTYARKAGRKFYWAVGADINYVGLTLEKDFTAHPSPVLSATGSNETKGETWALGWNMGLRYAATDKDEFGFAYRSRIKQNMSADFYTTHNPGGPTSISCWGEVMLPDSYHFGYSHKFDKKNRVELSAIRTNWSNFKQLTIHFAQPFIVYNDTTIYHNWKDTWRLAIGYEHKFSPKYTGMLGFAFDESGIPVNGGGFMVPIGTRKTYSMGVKYTDKWHTIAFTLGWQVEGDHNWIGQNALSGYPSGTDGFVTARMHDSIAKIFSIGYTYHF